MDGDEDVIDLTVEAFPPRLLSTWETTLQEFVRHSGKKLEPCSLDNIISLVKCQRLPRLWADYVTGVEAGLIQPLDLFAPKIMKKADDWYKEWYESLYFYDEEINTILHHLGGCRIPYHLYVLPGSLFWIGAGDPNVAIVDCLKRTGMALVEVVIVEHPDNMLALTHANTLIFNSCEQSITRFDPNGGRVQWVDPLLTSGLAGYRYHYVIGARCPSALNLVVFPGLTEGVCALWTLYFAFAIVMNPGYRPDDIITLLMGLPQDRVQPLLNGFFARLVNRLTSKPKPIIIKPLQ